MESKFGTYAPPFFVPISPFIWPQSNILLPYAASTLFDGGGIGGGADPPSHRNQHRIHRQQHKVDDSTVGSAVTATTATTMTIAKVDRRLIEDAATMTAPDDAIAGKYLHIYSLNAPIRVPLPRLIISPTYFYISGPAVVFAEIFFTSSSNDDDATSLVRSGCPARIRESHFISTGRVRGAGSFCNTIVATRLHESRDVRFATKTTLANVKLPQAYALAIGYSGTMAVPSVSGMVAVVAR